MNRYDVEAISGNTVPATASLTRAMEDEKFGTLSTHAYQESTTIVREKHVESANVHEEKLLDEEERPKHPFTTLDLQQTLIQRFSALRLHPRFSANKTPWDCQGVRN
ncbi:hypothetical protein Tco_1383265 [Tanacetum coccineum]